LSHQDYDKAVKKAVRFFWRTRKSASLKNKSGKRKDAGTRGAATAGKNLDGFIDLIRDWLNSEASSEIEIFQNQAVVRLPGHFRPTKKWDIVVMHGKKLLAALELKSLGGPSVGNNFNNRCEEAIGSGLDFRTAQREGAFGRAATPFLGFFILIHDADGSRKILSEPSLNDSFNCDPVFKEASYQDRMVILCERLMQEGLYSSAATMSSPSNAARSGEFADLTEETSFHRFLNKLQGHVRAETSLL